MHGVLVAAWVSGGRTFGGRQHGACKARVHCGPQSYIGNSTNGWETVQVVEPWQLVANGDPITGEVIECGVVFTPNSTCILVYLMFGFFSGADIRYSISMGTSEWHLGGPPDGFTGTGGGTGYQSSQIGSRISAGGRGQEQAWIFNAGTDGGASDVVFAQNRGAGLVGGWGPSIHPLTDLGTPSALAPYCGGCWVDNRFGLLYTTFVGENVYFLTTSNPADWSGGTSLNTGATGRVCGMSRHPSGRLVGMLQDTTTLAVTALISDDCGATWAATSALGITPAQPPQITCIGDVLYCVYLSSDNPVFLASTDGGDTWS